MNASAYIHISLIDLLIALLFVGVTALVSYWQGLGLERDIAVGTVRTFVQLLTVGFVLQRLFDASRWYWVAAS